MRLQDKLQEMKEKREAQSYFRENNSEYLEPMDYLKALTVGLLAAAAGGFLIRLVTFMTQWVFMYAFALVGYGVGIAVKRVTNVGNVKLAIIAVIAYTIGIVFGMVLFMGFNIGLGNFTYNLAMIYFAEIYSDIAALIFIIVGAICTYSVAKK
jgi:F0F1-type ATP synthase assembly protein I